MKKHYKLVRDKIPAIIEANGEKCKARILGEKEYIKELEIKIDEEVKEFLKAETKENAVEELADIQEVMLALLKVYGVSLEEFEDIRKKKSDKRGAFDDRIYLEETYQENEM